MKLKKIFTSEFLGKQVSRLKQAQNYYSLIMSSVSTLSLLRLAFTGDIPFTIIVLIIPTSLIATYFIGYYLDVKNVLSIDTLKTNEINQRFLNTTDIKTQEFQIINTITLLKGLKQLNTDGNININTLLEEFREYYDKWNIDKLPEGRKINFMKKKRDEK